MTAVPLAKESLVGACQQATSREAKRIFDKEVSVDSIQLTDFAVVICSVVANIQISSEIDSVFDGGGLFDPQNSSFIPWSR